MPRSRRPSWDRVGSSTWPLCWGAMPRPFGKGGPTWAWPKTRRPIACEKRGGRKRLIHVSPQTGRKLRAAAARPHGRRPDAARSEMESSPSQLSRLKHVCLQTREAHARTAEVATKSGLLHLGGLPVTPKSLCPAKARRTSDLTDGDPLGLFTAPSDFVLRYLEQFAILQGGLVRHDAGDGHIERLGDIDHGLAV